MKIRTKAPGLLSALEDRDVAIAVVYDDYGQPVLLVQQVAGGIIITSAREEEFSEKLRQTGINADPVPEVSEVSCKQQ